MTLNEGHGQYHHHVMHSHVCGSHSANLTMMTSTVFEESLARDTHTQTRTDFDLVYLKLFRSRKSDTKKGVIAKPADMPG